MMLLYLDKHQEEVQPLFPHGFNFNQAITNLPRFYIAEVKSVSLLR